MMLRKISALLLLLSLALLLPIFSSCGGRQRYDAYSFDSFDTVTSVIGYEYSEEEFDRVSEYVFAELTEYHRLYNIYKRYEGMENLCTVNELTDGQHRRVTVDRRIIDLLLFCKEIYALTEGSTNAAMGSVLSIWHTHREQGIDDPSAATLPDMAELRAAAEHTDFDAVEIDAENNTVFIKDPKVTLDVGAIAKGYAVEMVARSLEKEGKDGYLINAGGNVRAIGSKNGEGWQVGIENPDTSADGQYIKILEIEGKSVVTSGTYQRFYIVNGKSYHHIIDPNTLMPGDKYLSVTVVTDSSALADGLSTALFCKSLEEGTALVESLEGVEAMWVLPDGTVHESEGFSQLTE